jgi:hypothetical protein
VSEIKCKLRPIAKYEYVFKPEEGAKRKFGSYHGTYFWGTKGFGREKWVVTLTIEGIDIDQYLEEGLPEEEIVQRCLNFLSKPIGKRKKKQPYGNLELLKTIFPDGEKGRFTIRGDNKNKYITLLATINQKKNKNFWGKGQNVPGGRRRKRKK